MTAVTLHEARQMVTSLAATESLLLTSPPGIGKSAMVEAAARAAGLECRTLLGTQIAPEDVSGVPSIQGERSVFCPPRCVLPEDGRPYCLFLDELLSAPPEVQKAFYSLLLERRLGEHHLPAGTWVVAAGNAADKPHAARPISSALINRVFLVPIKISLEEWLTWGEAHSVRPEILSFMRLMPAALQRRAPAEPIPFSSPRSWALLSRDFDLAVAEGTLTHSRRRALAFGRVSPEDAGVFCSLLEHGLEQLLPVEEYFEHPERLPHSDTARWFVVSRVRHALTRGDHQRWSSRWPQATLAALANAFIRALPAEYRFSLVADQIDKWAALGANDALGEMLFDVTGLRGKRRE